MGLIDEFRAWRNTSTSQLLKTSLEYNHYASIHVLLTTMIGTLPDPNFDSIKKTINVDGSETFSFFFKETLEFEINILNPQGEFETNIVDYSLVSLENNTGWFITEDNFNLDLE